MIGERVYCAARSPADARAELLRCSGTQFDPDVVAAFLGALHDGQGDAPVASQSRSLAVSRSAAA
jgi:HD-GYP domain-containing protein (c-di-GMP phosphodiesterase class II)